MITDCNGIKIILVALIIFVNHRQIYGCLVNKVKIIAFVINFKGLKKLK